MHIMSDIPFILRPGENVIMTADKVQYRGPTIIADTLGGFAGSGGLGGFGARTKQRKREGSFLDAVMASIYLTNERLIVAKEGWHKHGLAAELELHELRAVQSGKTFIGPAIEIAVPSGSGVDNLSIIFIRQYRNARDEERDAWLVALKKGSERPVPPIVRPATEDPLTVLKMRLARGEISEEEYERHVKLLRV